MIEPYFSVYLNTSKELLKEEPLVRKSRTAWSRLAGYEKAIAALFAVSAFVAIALCLWSLFDHAVYVATGVVYAIFLVAFAAANRTMIVHARRDPVQEVRNNEKRCARLQKDLADVGLVTRDQILVVREEGVRILEAKSRQRDTVMSRSFEGLVLVALVWVLDFIAKLLEHDLLLEVAALLAVIAFIVLIAIMGAVNAVWKVKDRYGALPLSELGGFVEALSLLLVQGDFCTAADREAEFPLPRLAYDAGSPLRVTLRKRRLNSCSTQSEETEM